MGWFDSYDVPADAGVTNSTGPFTTAPADATGGSGSFLQALLPTLTNGVNAALNYELEKNFGLGSNSGLAAVDADGNLVYKGAPGDQAVNIAPSYAAKSFFSSTAGLLTIAIVGGALIWLVAKK